jgi:hypothetical protein
VKKAPADDDPLEFAESVKRRDTIASLWKSLTAAQSASTHPYENFKWSSCGLKFGDA